VIDLGTIPMDSGTIELNTGQEGRYWTWTTTDDMGRQEIDGIIGCNIEVDNSKYLRNFLIKEYNQIHFKNFLKKFARDAEYRKKWIVEENYASVLEN
jgi:hypothetical protein